MDLPNIQVVVQWKATCDMCTLWQRFGRGGRGDGQSATAILLVEKKDTEEDRQAKGERARVRKEKEGIGTKRKATTDQEDRPSKRSRTLTDVPAIPTSSPNPSTTSPKPTAQVKEERRKLYSTRALLKTATKAKKGKAGAPMEVAMDDYINTAHVPLNCRVDVPTLYFNNDKTRELYRSPNRTMSEPSCSPKRPYSVQHNNNRWM
jgi:superfamily II DNA/RNA helicase